MRGREGETEVVREREIDRELKSVVRERTNEVLYLFCSEYMHICVWSRGDVHMNVMACVT